MLKKLTSMALWKQILICIVLGAIVGIWAPGVVPRIKFLGDIFLRLLKMLIAPLVLFTLISGVCKMGGYQASVHGGDPYRSLLSDYLHPGRRLGLGVCPLHPAGEGGHRSVDQPEWESRPV